MSVEHTTLTGGAPNCHLTAQVEVRSWVGNRADDELVPGRSPGSAASTGSGAAARAAAPEPARPRPWRGHARALAPLRITRTGTTLRVTVPPPARCG